MGLDEELSDLRSAIRKRGAHWVQSECEWKRERALDRRNQKEAEFWEQQREAVSAYVAQRRLKFNLLASGIGIVLALLAAGYLWLHGEGIFVSATAFAVLAGALYLGIRFIERVLAWFTGILFLAAIGTLMWEVYVWLREAHWPSYRVGDVFARLGVPQVFVTIDGWAGVSSLMNSVYHWLLNLSLPAGCFFLGALALALTAIVQTLDLPKTSDEEGI